MKSVLLSLMLLVSAASAEKFVIVAEDDWYPYSAAVNGKPEGFSVDVVKAAYKAAGHEVDYKLLTYNKCMADVSEGKEIGCFDTIIDENVLKTQQFHKEPLFTAKLMIYAKADSTATGLTIKDLAKKKVGVTAGYTYGDEFEKNTEMIKEQAPQDLFNLRKLIAGRIDYAIVYEKVGESIIGKNKSELFGKVKPVGQVGSLDVFVSFSKKHPQATKAMDEFDKGLKAIKANGEYKKIEETWTKKLASGN